MHLVYWYGAELRSGFGWIEQKEWSKKFISFEDGRSKGYLDIPSSIMKKVETYKKLTKAQQERLNAVSQIKIDHALPKEERIAWLTRLTPSPYSNEKSEVPKLKDNQKGFLENIIVENETKRGNQLLKEKRIDELLCQAEGKKNKKTKGKLDYTDKEKNREMTESAVFQTVPVQILNDKFVCQKHHKKNQTNPQLVTGQVKKNTIIKSTEYVGEKKLILKKGGKICRNGSATVTKVANQNITKGTHEREGNDVEDVKRFRLKNKRLKKVIENNCSSYQKAIADLKENAEAERTELIKTIEKNRAEYQISTSNIKKKAELERTELNKIIEEKCVEHQKYIEHSTCMDQASKAERMKLKDKIVEIEKIHEDEIRIHSCEIDVMKKELLKERSKMSSGTTTMKMFLNDQIKNHELLNALLQSSKRQINMTKALNNLSNHEGNMETDDSDGTLSRRETEPPESKVVSIRL